MYLWACTTNQTDASDWESLLCNEVCLLHLVSKIALALWPVEELKVPWGDLDICYNSSSF